jgi:hypothetical protein
MTIWAAQPSPAQARRGPGKKRPSPKWPDRLRARVGRHYGLRLWPSTSPRLSFQVGPARATIVGMMSHPTRASPRPDEGGQRHTSGRQESEGGGGNRSVDSAGEGEVGRRWPGAEEVADVVDRPVRRKKRRLLSRRCAGGRCAMDAGAPPPPSASPRQRSELPHRRVWSSSTTAPQIRLAVLFATLVRPRSAGRERWSRDGRGGGGRRRSVGRGAGQL